MTCSECGKNPTPNSFTFTCSTRCSEVRNRRLTRERTKARRAAPGSGTRKDTTPSLAKPQNASRKLCGYCRKSFIPRDHRHRYCKEACGAKARHNRTQRYKQKPLRVSKHIVRALDRFEERYGTRVPAEVPEAVSEWCELLREAA
jgi:hypothetical protein